MRTRVQNRHGLEGAARIRPKRAELRRNPNSARLISKKQIRAYCQALVSEFRPQKIVLFGSYAYGRPTSDSDVDLLVVLPFRGSDLKKAIEIRSRFNAPFPLDLFVRKPQFIAERLGERDMFLEGVMKEGHVLYESQHA